MTYNPAPVLYRRAMVASQQAAEIAAGTRPVTVNPSARIGDACIVAITLSHAAVETAWFHAQADVGLDPLEWPKNFEMRLFAESFEVIWLSWAFRAIIGGVTSTRQNWRPAAPSRSSRQPTPAT